MGEVRRSTQAEEAAISGFLAMEMHVSDCWTCRQVEPAFQAAMRRKDMDEVRRLVRTFCPAMNRLAEQFAITCHTAFGKPTDG